MLGFSQKLFKDLHTDIHQVFHKNRTHDCSPSCILLNLNRILCIRSNCFELIIATYDSDRGIRPSLRGKCNRKVSCNTRSYIQP